MSDHIDGPRQVGDPAADLSDLFAFISPENHSRTVLAAMCFPLRRHKCDVLQRRRIRHRGALGHRGRSRRRCEVSSRERRKFGSVAVSTISNAPPQATSPVQSGTCTLPDGRTSPSSSTTKKGHQRRTASSAYLRDCVQTRFIWRGLIHRQGSRFKTCCCTITCSLSS